MKKVLIVGIIALILTIGGIAGYKFLSPPKSEVVEEVPTPTVVLPTISDKIVVDLTPKNDNKVVVLRINGLTPDIESIEYELTYLTGAGLPRGVLGKISLRGEKEILRDDITLGTCSSGKCAYDTGVTSIDLSLKFNYTSGESSIFQKTYPL